MGWRAGRQNKDAAKVLKRRKCVRVTTEGRIAVSTRATRIKSRPRRDKFEMLLAHVRDCNGFDFTGYKRPSLMRGVQSRMRRIGVHDFGAYLQYLKAQPGEFTFLFDRILINVTEFYRDPPAWKFLAEAIVPRILGRKNDRETIRAWSVGCASGEEAYTMAMVFAEALGEDAFRRRVTIFGSDVDASALVQARRGIYLAKDLLKVPPNLRRKYFEAENGNFIFRPALRHSMLFCRHDVIQDPPFAHLDLIVCRNTLIYFEAATQKRILARFHYSLSEHGCLFLGKGELTGGGQNLFKQERGEHAIFTKVTKMDCHDRLAIFAQAGSLSAGHALESG